ncbi:MAG: peptidase C39 family protein [Chloroflexi bacterium]|nr:MAG: peptidase C39 family protein [Chloroflexota bacterium]
MRVGFTLLAAVALLLAQSARSVTSAAQPYPVSYHAFALAAGTGTVVDRSGALVLGSTGLATTSYTDPHRGTTRSYEVGTWTSPAYATGFGFSELVSSWIAETPTGTFIRVSMQAVRADGSPTKWYTMGIWASGDSDADILRTSVGGQGDADGFVAIDTFFAKDHPMWGYELGLALYRPVGSSASPAVRRIGAVASDPVNTKPYLPSATTMTGDIVLGVPAFSQEIHAGEFPEYDGGGEAWCNHYNGAGNWPFNVAYAGRFGLDGQVTQLRSLAEAERFIKAGIPLVASIAFTSNKLDGFLFKSTAGHLLVIVGFTKEGNPVVNDPAATSDASVRRTYDRAQFERNWMTSTGGIVYVIYPRGKALPANVPGVSANW